MRLALGLDLPERRIGLVRARFRAASRRPRRDLEPCGKDRRHADGGVALHPAPRRGRRRAMADCSSARSKLSRPGRANSIGRSRSNRRRSRRPRRRARRAPRVSRSPRSSIGCAIPIRSTPSTFCGCARSMRWTHRPAPPSAARSFTPRSAISPSSMPRAFPPTRRREIIALGQPHFAALDDFPEARAFWWPRFLAHRPLVRTLGRRHDAARSLASRRKSAARFRFRSTTARSSSAASPTASSAPPDGRYVILDYKTGSARSEKQVRTGLAPQLTLEAAMLRHGGFKTIAARRFGRRDRLRAAQRRRAARPI